MLSLLGPVLGFGVGTLSGTVTDSDGDPISGATVKVYRSQVLVATTTTDGSGDYSVGSLTSRWYNIVANTATHEAVWKSAKVKNNKTVDLDFTLTASVGIVAGTITEAGTSTAIENATVQLCKGNILIAQDTTDSSGAYSIGSVPIGEYLLNVIYSTHEDVSEGITILANQTITKNFSMATSPGTLAGQITDTNTTNGIEDVLIEALQDNIVHHSTVTDSNGDYSISGVAPGEYTIVTNVEGYKSGAAGTIVLSGSTSTINIAVDTLGGTLVGTVTDSSTGAVLENVNVQVHQDNVTVATVITDSRGLYVVENLEPGTYVIHVSKSTHRMFCGTINVVSDEIVNENFNIPPTPVNLSGTVTDSNGTGIAGAHVQVFLDQHIVFYTEANADGEYSIQGGAPRPYTVHARFNGYQTQSDLISMSETGSNVLDFRLPANPATISGTVKNSSDTGIERALVEVKKNNQIIQYVLTDENGAYTIQSLPAGSVRIYAHNASYQTGYDTLTLTAGQTTTKNFTLASSPATISGTVKNSVTNLPVANVFVYLTDSSGNIYKSNLTTSTGTYSITGMFEGTVFMNYAFPGYITGITSAISTSAGQTTTQDISIDPSDSPPASISGEVVVDKFVFQTDVVHKLSWTASPSSAVTGYRIYLNGVSIADVGLETRSYNIHYRSLDITDTYEVRSINSDGSESSGVSITFQKQ